MEQASAPIYKVPCRSNNRLCRSLYSAYVLPTVLTGLLLHLIPPVVRRYNRQQRPVGTRSPHAVRPIMSQEEEKNMIHQSGRARATLRELVLGNPYVNRGVACVSTKCNDVTPRCCQAAVG